MPVPPILTGPGQLQAQPPPLRGLPPPLTQVGSPWLRGMPADATYPAVQFVGAGTWMDTTAPNPPVAYPPGIQSGDVLILVLGQAAGGAPPNQTGFTGVIQHSSTGDASAPSIYMGYKVATGSETGTFTTTLTGTSTVTGQILAFRGVDTSVIQEDTAQYLDKTVTGTGDYPIPSMTADVDNAAFVYFANANTTGAGSFTPPTSPAQFTETGDRGAGVRLATAGYLVWRDSGATGTMTIVCTQTVRGVAGMMALRPAGAVSAAVAEGTADLTAVGDLSVTGDVTAEAAADLTAVGSLTATGLGTAVAAADLAATSSLSATGVVTQPATAALNAISDLALGAGGVVATNLVPDPSFEVDTAGWSGNADTGLATTTAAAVSGSKSMRMTKSTNGSGNISASTPLNTTTIPATAGLDYTLSAHAKSATTHNWQINLTFLNSSSSSVGSFSTPGDPLTSSFDRFSITATAPANTVAIRVTVTGFSFAVTETMDVDAVMLTQGASLIAYFDGDTADAGGFVYDWTGTAHASASTKSTAGVLVTAVASAALTATGTLSATGLGTAVASAALTATGALSATATPVAVSSADLAATSSLTATGLGTAVASADLTAAGTLSATGLGTAVASAALTAVGALSATAAPIVEASADLAASSALTATGTRVVEGTAALTAVGNLTATGLGTAVASAALTATATLFALPNVVTFVGAGAWTDDTAPNPGIPYPSGIRAGDVLVLMFGAGSSSVPSNQTGFTAVIRHSSTGDTANPSIYVGYKVATGSESGSFTTTISGSVTVAGQILAFRNVDLTNVQDTTADYLDKTSTANGNFAFPAMTTTQTGAALVYFVNQNLATGTGSFTPPSAPAAFTETGDRTGAQLRLATAGYLIWNASGSTGTVTVVSTASARGVGGLIALRPVGVVATLSGSADLTAVGTLSATGLGTAVAAADLTATSTLSVTAVATAAASAALAATSSLTATGDVTGEASAALTATSSLSATATPTAVASAALTAAGSLTATATPIAVASAALTAAGSLSATATPVAVASAALTAAGSLSATAVRAVAAAADLHAVSELTAGGGIVEATADLTATSSLTATGFQAISFDSSGSAARTTAGSTMTVNISSAAVGSVVYIWGLWGGNPTSVQASGWTTVTDTQLGSLHHYFLLRRVKQSGDTTFTVTCTGDTGKAACGWVSYRAVDLVGFQEQLAYTGSTAANQSLLTTPSRTPGGPDRWAVALFTNRNSTSLSTFTPGTGLTERVDAGNVGTVSTPYVSVEIADSNGVVTQTAHQYTTVPSQAAASTAAGIMFLLQQAVTTAAGAADLTAIATLSTLAGRETFASPALIAVSSLTTTGTRQPEATAALTATGTLSATGLGTAVASADLSASSSLTATGIRAVAAAADLTASGSLSATGVRTQPATAALQATSDLAVSATREQFAAAALTASSSLSATATPVAVASVDLTAASSLSATATPVAVAAVDLRATGDLTATAYLEQFAAAALTATGTLSAVGVREQPATAALTASSSLSAEGGPTVFAAADLAAVSNLTTTGVRQPQGTAALTASSSLTATAVVSPLIDFSENFEGAANGVAVSTATTSFDAVSNATNAITHSTARSVSGSRSARILGQSSILQMRWNVAVRAENYWRDYILIRNTPDVATGIITADHSTGGNRARVVLQPDRTLTLRNGPSAIVATSSPLPMDRHVRLEWHTLNGTTQELRIWHGPDLHSTGPPTETISGAYNAGTYDRLVFGSSNAAAGAVFEMYHEAVAVGSLTWIGPVAAPNMLVELTATSSLSATGSRIAVGSAGIRAVSDLVFTAARLAEASAALTATGTLSAAGTRAAAAAADLAATSTLNVAGTRQPEAAADLAAVSDLTTTGLAEAVASAALTATSDLLATGTRQPEGVADLTATSDLTASGAPLVIGAADLTASSSLSATATPEALAAADLTAASDLSAVGSVTAEAAAALTAVSDLNAAAEREAAAAVALQAVSDLQASAGEQLGVADLAAVSLLSAVGERALPGLADLTATGNLTVEGVRDVATTLYLQAFSDLLVAADKTAVGAAALIAHGSLAAAEETAETRFFGVGIPI